MKRFATMVCALTLSSAAAAQTPDPEFTGWASAPAANEGMSYTAPENAAFAVLGRIASAEQNAAVVETFARRFVAPGLCPSLASAVPRVSPDARLTTLESENNGNRCTVVVAQSGEGAFDVGFALETGAGTLDARSRLRRAITRRIGPAMTTAAPTVARSSAASGTGSTSLQAALAAVPKANRPIALVSREASSMSGMFVYTVYRHWMVFANGYATDSNCYDWDPAVTAPTPAGLTGKPHECRVVRWRKAGTRYQFDDDNDGSFGGKDANAVLQPFKPGERIQVALENVSGTGSGPAIPGLISVNSITSGELKMTMAGEISVGSWTSVVISGDNIGGGGSSGQGPAIGNYLLDGFLIAIATKQGAITRGFIGQVYEGGDRYIYLNGRQYWEPDKK